MMEEPMSSDLAEAVEKRLLPVIAPLGFSIVETVTGTSFDNATVKLQNADMRVRITRERGVVEVDFGPVSQPATWFDSDVVMRYLRVSNDGGLQLQAPRVLEATGAFILTFSAEIAAMLDSRLLDATTATMEDLKKKRFREQFGPWLSSKEND